MECRECNKDTELKEWTIFDSGMDWKKNVYQDYNCPICGEETRIYTNVSTEDI